MENVREAARTTGVNLSTFQQRLQGSTTRQKARERQQLLTTAQEKVLADYCKQLDSWGYPLQVPYLREYAEAFIPIDAEHGLGDHWVTRFLGRWPVLRSKFVEQVRGAPGQAAKGWGEPELHAGVFPEGAGRFREITSALANVTLQLEKAVKQHNLQTEDIYNFDEKGFMLGMGHKVRAITTRGRNAGRLTQDGNRESVTIVETIGADGSVPRPLIIWKGKVHTHGMNASLVKQNRVAFTTSKKGTPIIRLPLNSCAKYLSLRPLRSTNTTQHTTPTPSTAPNISNTLGPRELADGACW